MKYQNYTVFDFLKDEDFQDWLKKPSPEKDFYWESLMENFPEKKGTLAQAKEIYQSIKFKGGTASQEVEDRVFKKIIAAERPTKADVQSKDRVLRWQFFNKGMGIAASVALLVMLGIWWANNLNEGSDRGNSIPSDLTMTLKETLPGQKTTFKLSDGTMVKLNAGSKMEFTEKFVGDSREVYLEGEAFFEVAQDSIRPFIIHTDNMQTTVLGTSFNVRAYKGETYQGVSVATGKVEVKRFGPSLDEVVYLAKNEEAVVHSRMGKFTKSNFDFEKRFGWKDGVILFESANMEEIVQTLERWYGVTIDNRVNRSIGKGYSAKYKNETLATIMEAMSFSLGFQYTIDGDYVTIYNNNK